MLLCYMSKCSQLYIKIFVFNSINAQMCVVEGKKAIKIINNTK